MFRSLFLVLFPLLLAITTHALPPLVCGDLFSRYGTRLLLSADGRKAAAYAQQNPDFKAAVTELAQLQANGKLNSNNPRAIELIIKVSAGFQDLGMIGKILDLVTKEAEKAGKLPEIARGNKRTLFVQQLTTMVDAELSARGLTKASQGVEYESWVKLSHRMASEVEPLVKGFHESVPQNKVLFEDSQFIAAFEKQTQTKFTSKNHVELLVDGPASFAKLNTMIENAQKSIHILSWALYDDITGTQLAEKLIAKSKLGIDVKVMVDGQVAMQPKHQKTLKSLEEAGIPVIRWLSSDKLRRFDGQHRKIAIVDGIHSRSGGMNAGDVYSHFGPPDTPKWRDTDVFITGEVSKDAQELFIKLWNEQIQSRGVIDGKTLKPMKLADYIETEDLPAQANLKMALLNHTPGVTDNILRSNLIAIESARKTIEIENAYFILYPGLYQALLRAKQRGVRIRILTNSGTSIDEPIVSLPILKSVNRLVENGFEVYVKKGNNTLHSKVMRVDGVFGWVGSHNFHPRSYRYEGEAVMLFNDAQFGEKVGQMLEADFENALQVTTPIPLPKNESMDIGHALFYDQL